MADPQQNDDSNQLTDIELERLKLYQDSFKHMTTFCSGAILLSAAVTGALIPKPDYVLFLVFSIFLFAAGVASAMIGLINVPRCMDLVIDSGTSPTTQRLRYMLGSSVGGAYLGLTCFAFFAVTNLAP